MERPTDRQTDAAPTSCMSLATVMNQSRPRPVPAVQELERLAAEAAAKAAEQERLRLEVGGGKKL